LNCNNNVTRILAIMHKSPIGSILSKYCTPSVNMRASDVKIICGNILLIVHTKTVRYSSVYLRY